MPNITCPECGRQTDLVAIRRSAEEFCQHCDYPLFWAPSTVPSATPGANSASTLRRLPGAGGRHRVGSKICPDCGELNPLSGIHCLRCNADLDPKPVAPVVVVPAPVRPVAVVQPPAPPPPRVTPWWWWASGAVVGSAIVGLVLSLL